MLFQVGAIQAAATGVLGLTLAVIGIYGLISYRTAQRSREIGIRLALGAQARDVRTLVLQQGGRLAVTGIGVGLAIALAFRAGVVAHSDASSARSIRSRSAA